MKKTKLAIIHYLPLEDYPPVCNMIDFLSSKPMETYVFCCSGVRQAEKYENDMSKICRFPFSKKNDFFIVKLIKIFLFNIGTLIRLIKIRPAYILYYEPHSAWPVYYYCRYFNPKAKLFIHYHEYYQPSHFLDKGMFFARLNNRYERQYLYNKAEWISQANAYRCKLFAGDNPQVEKQKIRILPNYPPKKWGVSADDKGRREGQSAPPHKCVYVGALSLADTYIKEFCEWVIQLNGKISFDIYSYNIHKDTAEYLNGLKSPFITYSPGYISYNKLPSYLNKYDIGVILYKCRTLNYVHNATNKLFEYLCCGLDVWFPQEMIGVHEFISTDSKPMVLSLDYKNLVQHDLEQMTSRNGLKHREYNLFCDEVYNDFYNFMIK